MVFCSINTLLRSLTDSKLPSHPLSEHILRSVKLVQNTVISCFETPAPLTPSSLPSSELCILLPPSHVPPTEMALARGCAHLVGSVSPTWAVHPSPHDAGPAPAPEEGPGGRQLLPREKKKKKKKTFLYPRRRPPPPPRQAQQDHGPLPQASPPHPRDGEAFPEALAFPAAACQRVLPSHPGTPQAPT